LSSLVFPLQALAARVVAREPFTSVQINEAASGKEYRSTWGATPRYRYDTHPMLGVVWAAPPLRHTFPSLLAAASLHCLSCTLRSALWVVLACAGGAALREGLAALLRARGGRIYHPRIAFCTDNAAMIAVAGLLRLQRGEGSHDLTIRARAQWPLAELSAHTVPAAAAPLSFSSFKEQA
jgi:tRNA A37 threonylcarbamoyltransferase TsaD